jgi:Zn-finger nucleic acid-binding protein
MEIIRKRRKKSDAAPNLNHLIVKEGERPCPICKKKMATQICQESMVDVCAEHGIWLDNNELESILKVKKRARSKRQHRLNRQMVTRAKKNGRLEGAMLGHWALFL